MARDRNRNGNSQDTVISIVGPGMRVTGDCETDGTVRIEGQVDGSVRAGKAVVVGKDGLVEGDITTQDAVISGRVLGTVVAESRLELQATCRIEGRVLARRMQLEEGALLNGTVEMGEVSRPEPVLGPRAEPQEEAPRAPRAATA
jgi:cytoskeletal protein CcmA (bactofilin family)